MNHKSNFSEMMRAFFVCTTCICILQGVMGMLLYPNEEIPYNAFLVPPIFGLFSVLLGVVTWSKEELTIRQVLVRRVIHLLLVEVMVFGLNYLAGNVFPPLISVILFLGIAIVFVAVYVILWLNDRKSARIFNEKLKSFQKNNYIELSK